MGKAARAIIIEGDKILVMHRHKHGAEYFTLVGGKVNDNETVEQALVREIKEETGLDITNYQLVYFEEHPEPYNQQYIFYCQVAPHGGEVSIQEYSEEDQLNRLDMNRHQPMWVPLTAFKGLQFRTPQLHEAINKALHTGFPAQPVKL